MIGISRLASPKNCLGLMARKISPLVRYQPRASVHQVWPEPVTLPTIIDFLDQINYYEDPRKVMNIGIEQDRFERIGKVMSPNKGCVVKGEVSNDGTEGQPDLDKVLQLLGEELDHDELNFDRLNSDWTCSKAGMDQLAKLASHFGIYRDLFTGYESPKRGPITFTKEQAEELDRFVPHYWITDLPFSKVPLRSSEEPMIYFFNPVVPIVAKFVSEVKNGSSQSDDDEILGNVVYHGNFIQACDGGRKPSISLDGRILSEINQDSGIEAHKSEPKINCYESSWTSGDVQLNNFSSSYKKYLTLVLLNLDTIYGNDAMAHWIITNLHQTSPSQQGGAKFDEVCDFLPVYGINGFGQSRYVFVLFEHDEKLQADKVKVDGFSPENRRFKAMDFIEKNKSVNLRPVGLSWFQTSWDSTSDDIFRDYLKMRAPRYEYILPQVKLAEDKPYPGRVPFNLHLDTYRNRKDINKQVLLERLKEVDPFNYKDQFEPPRVPKDIHRQRVPDWMKVTVWKKNNKLGYWRGLRPASALLPLNNNADLDRPCRPLPSAVRVPYLMPNPYPGKPKIKKLKDQPHYGVPVNDLPSVYIDPGHERHLSEEDRKKAGL